MTRRPLLIGCAFSAVFLGGYLLLLSALDGSPWVHAFDLAVSRAVASVRTPALTQLMRVVTDTGGTIAVVVMLLVLVGWQLSRHRVIDAVFSVVVVASGALVSTLTKYRLQRLRPPAEGALVLLPPSYSFPSGHSMASLCLGAAFAYSVLHSEMRGSRKMLALALCLIYPLAVGFSRVYLGVHYPSDVMGSWLLGLAIISVCWGAAEQVRAGRLVEASRT